MTQAQFYWDRVICFKNFYPFFHLLIWRWVSSLSSDAKTVYMTFPEFFFFTSSSFLHLHRKGSHIMFVKSHGLANCHSNHFPLNPPPPPPYTPTHINNSGMMRPTEFYSGFGPKIMNKTTDKGHPSSSPTHNETESTYGQQLKPNSLLVVKTGRPLLIPI